MGGARGSGSGSGAGVPNLKRGGDADGSSSREALRLKQLRGKKERLSYAVERLVLQAQQKERLLRNSVAAQ